MSTLKDKYRDHKWNAKKNGVQFNLTFDQWLDVWIGSGHLHERGRHSGQYVMARFGDSGPYEIGNIKIIPHIDNIKERRFSADVLAQKSAERIGKPHLGPKKHSPETILAMSRARKTYWEKKKGEQSAFACEAP